MGKRRGKKGGKKSKAIPLAMAIPIAYIGYDAVKGAGGDVRAALNAISVHTTGYSPMSGTFNVDWAKAFWLGEIAAIIVHKAANKTGVNKAIKKFTMGYLTI